MSTVDDYVSTHGQVAIPMTLSGQGVDISTCTGDCTEVRVLQYPFERRFDEADADYATRLRNRFNELTKLSDFRPGSFLQDIDPAYAAELCALYYALLNDIGIPEDGLALPARSPDEYASLCLVFGVNPTDWLFAEPAEGHAEQLFDQDSIPWITSNVDTGQAHLWAAATFPGPDGRLYYRFPPGISVWGVEIETNPLLDAYASQGYALPNATFDDHSEGWLRDLFWELYTSVGADIQQFGPPPSEWFDQSAATPVRTLDIFYGSEPSALQFEPFEVAQNNTQGLRTAISNAVRRGTIGSNRLHSGVVFGSMRRAAAGVQSGAFSRTELNAAIAEVGPRHGVRNSRELLQMARTDPDKATDIANRVFASARLRNPTRQAQMQAARSRGSRAIEAQGGEVNHQSFTVRDGRDKITVVPDGLKGGTRDASGRVIRMDEVHESKDVAQQSLTRQLRGQLILAANNQAKFILHIRRSTHLSGPLQDALKAHPYGVQVLGFDGIPRTLR